MRRTLLLAVLGLVSAVAALLVFVRPRTPAAPATAGAGGPIGVSAQLDRRFHPESGGDAWLEVDLTGATLGGEERPGADVALVIDRSGSMAGVKIERAREAAARVLDALDSRDSFSLVAFESRADLLVAPTPVTEESRARALQAIARLVPEGGTNLSAALERIGPPRQGRYGQVFIVSDGRVNEGLTDRARLVALSRRGGTVSTLGVGDDYDEDLLAAIAEATGGRTRFVRDAGELSTALRSDLQRGLRAVATAVRLRVDGERGSEVSRIAGHGLEDGWARLPDFSAGEERRVYVRLRLAPGKGQSRVARVRLELEDRSGRRWQTDVPVEASFTSDATKLAEAPGRAAVEGARAEMAELARDAAVLRESGRAQEADRQLRRIDGIAGEVARFAPRARKAAIRDEAAAYSSGVRAIATPGDAASKRLKQKAFDVARAPVAGW